MVGGKKETKICDKGWHEDRISQLPDPLICDILIHLSTKDVVRTSVLSTRWRSLWQWIPGRDLDSRAFSNFGAFVCFADSFFDSHKGSWIRKLRLGIHDSYGKSFLPWIDAVTTRKVQHLDACFDTPYGYGELPASIFTCETLVHLHLSRAALVDAEFVSLPCLKIIHLECIRYLNEDTLDKLISCSPLLEDLTIIRYAHNVEKVLQVRSPMLKRIHINQYTEVVIDAPLLQCLRTKIYTNKNFEIVNSDFSGKLDIDVVSTSNTYDIHDILTDVSKVRDLVIRSDIWTDIFLYQPLLKLRYLSRFNARISISDLEMLPVFLESYPKLESLILELCEKRFFHGQKNREPKVMFSAVPQCLLSSLKFVELQCSILEYEGVMELVRYFLKNSIILDKLKVDTYCTKEAKHAILKELLAMPR